MKIIEKIEIKHFRSFLGSPKPYAIEVTNLKDINIFSGANDSGKSNVLRALNLFFNDEIASNIPLVFERDFFVSKQESVQKVIEISVSFNLTDDKKDSFLPDRFTISKFYDRNGLRNYIYSFYLKELDKNVKIDSRAEKNKDVKYIFMSDKPTPEEERRAERREWGYRVKFSGFLNQTVTYEYVPAIRDKDFFAQLFGRVITRIKDNEDSRLSGLAKEKNKIINWEKTITNKSERKEFKASLLDEDWRKLRIEEIESELKKESKLSSAIASLEAEINKYSSDLISSINFLPAEFKIGKDLREFFEGFDVGTGSDKTISLNLRGDGVQAKFVPKILDFLSQLGSRNRYYLWGIEEPENSAEYKNQQELARDLKERFSTSKQIFLTTHSEEFLQLYDGNEVPADERRASLYHVKKRMMKDETEYSQIYFFDVDKNEFEFANQKAELDDDLGQSRLRAKYSKELKEKEEVFLTQKKDAEAENAHLQDFITQNNKPIIFFEDKYTQLYKIAWLKLNNIVCDVDNYAALFDGNAPYTIYSAEGATFLAGFLRTKNLDYWNGKKILGVFDFDEAGLEQFRNLKDQRFWRTGFEGSKNTGLYKTRHGHDCFHAMLLPIPERLSHLADLTFPSFVEAENLLPEIFLTTNNLSEQVTTTGNTAYQKIKDDKKPNLWKKTFTLSDADFQDFRPLFDTADALFE